MFRLPAQVRLCLRLVTTVTLLCVMGVLAAISAGGHLKQAILTFTSNRGGSSQVYLLDEMTHQPRLLPAQATSAFQAAWSPRYTLAVVNPSPLHISLVDSYINGKTTLSLNRNWNDYQPDWSSSAQLAIATDQHIHWDIVIYSKTGADYAFAPFNTEANELDPCWWPDGRISFVSDREGNSDVYVYDFEAKTTTNLTDDPANDYNPACSTEDRLAFTSTRDLNAEVYVLDMKTGDAVNVTRNPAADFNPAWLPDGRLSFVSDREGNREIYVLDLGSGQLTNITQNPANDDQPAWTR